MSGVAFVTVLISLYDLFNTDISVDSVVYSVLIGYIIGALIAHVIMAIKESR